LARARAEECYSWHSVVDAYERLILHLGGVLQKSAPDERSSLQKRHRVAAARR